MIGIIKPEIEAYAQAKSSDHGSLLNNLMHETQEKMTLPQMLSGPLEGRFLKMIVQIARVKNILEIGMFTGYSALSMAEGLVGDGNVTTLELDPQAIEIASKYFAQSPFGKKIKIIAGPAETSLKNLEGPFDLVFIDADKTNYLNYYKACLPKLVSGGIILVDNTLWGAEVLDPKTADAKAIAEFNDFVANDNRVTKVLTTIRDGVTFIIKS